MYGQSYYPDAYGYNDAYGPGYDRVMYDTAFNPEYERQSHERPAHQQQHEPRQHDPRYHDQSRLSTHDQSRSSMHHRPMHQSTSRPSVVKKDAQTSNALSRQPHHSSSQQLAMRNGQKGYYDALCSMRPGPLTEEYNPERATRADNTKLAFTFVRKELGPLTGNVHVIYESVRKFGRFDVEDGNIVLAANENEQDYIDGLGRLWQIGDGFIYVKQSERKQNHSNVYVYHIDHNSYRKLDPKDAADVISSDPLWKKISSYTELRFI